MGARTGDLPEKPEELRLYELAKKTGLPLVAGGLLDQPHMWLDAIELIESIQKIYTLQAQTNAQSNQPGAGNMASDLMKPMRLT